MRLYTVRGGLIYIQRIFVEFLHTVYEVVYDIYVTVYVQLRIE